ncbi:unnamed protein product, partial [Ectocarpus sp. 4 AP-2014]
VNGCLVALVTAGQSLCGGTSRVSCFWPRTERVLSALARGQAQEESKRGVYRHTGNS